MHQPHVIHAAIAAHLGHAAMVRTDAMTDTLCDLVDEACAVEGALPPSLSAHDGPTAAQWDALAAAERDPGLAWLMVVFGALVAVGSVLVQLLAGAGVQP